MNLHSDEEPIQGGEMHSDLRSLDFYGSWLPADQSAINCILPFRQVL